MALFHAKLSLAVIIFYFFTILFVYLMQKDGEIKSEINN